MKSSNFCFLSCDNSTVCVPGLNKMLDNKPGKKTYRIPERFKGNIVYGSISIGPEMCCYFHIFTQATSSTDIKLLSRNIVNNIVRTIIPCMNTKNTPRSGKNIQKFIVKVCPYRSHKS